MPPHTEDEKNQEFARAPFGIVGLETALSLTLSLVKEGFLTLPEAISKLTVQPARVMRLNKGQLGIGADADITIIDPNAEWVVDPRQFRSKSRNTPFGGWKMKGLVAMTIVGGFERRVRNLRYFDYVSGNSTPQIHIRQNNVNVVVFRTYWHWDRSHYRTVDARVGRGYATKCVVVHDRRYLAVSDRRLSVLLHPP